MWNYRIIKKGELYGLYEVIYNDDGEISAHDEEPTLTGESPEDLLRSIEIMLKDVKKNFSSFYPLVVDEEKILKYDKIKFAPLINEDEELIMIKDLDDLIKKTDKNETN